MILSKIPIIGPIIPQDSCYFNMPLRKPPKRYPSNTFLKRDFGGATLTIPHPYSKMRHWISV